MIIVRPNALEAPAQQKRTTFTGDVWADPVLPTIGGVTINTIVFTPGARTFWHSHEHGQILQVIAGNGLICTDGATPQVLHVGDIVWVPPGERHWHGASAESMLSHVAISLGTTHWAEEVVLDDTPTNHRSRESHGQ